MLWCTWLSKGFNLVSAQKSVHVSFCDLHPHLLVEHGLLLSHPHCITFSSSAGANALLKGTIVGMSLVVPSTRDQPWSVGSSDGGLGCKSVSPHSQLVVGSECILAKCFGGWWQGAEFGWFESTPPHLCLPASTLGFRQGRLACQVVAGNNESSSLLNHLVVGGHR